MRSIKESVTQYIAQNREKLEQAARSKGLSGEAIDRLIEKMAQDAEIELFKRFKENLAKEMAQVKGQSQLRKYT